MHFRKKLELIIPVQRLHNIITYVGCYSSLNYEFKKNRRGHAKCVFENISKCINEVNIYTFLRTNYYKYVINSNVDKIKRILSI